MKRYTLLLVVLLALTACVSDGDAPPAAVTALPTLATIAPPATLAATPTSAITVAPSATPALDPAIERPDTPAPPLTPVASATPGPSGFRPPAEGIPGFSDGLVLAPPDGSLIVYTPADGRVETLLGPGYYTLNGESGPVDTIWPPRFSPDGRLMVAPRPAGDTWLIHRGPTGDAAPMSTVSKLHDLRLWFTWAPDSRRIVYTLAGQAPEVSRGQVYVQDVVTGDAPRLLVDLPPFAAWPVWSPGCAATAATGDCGRSIAVSAADGDAIAIWLVDATTGAARKLGRFRPPPVDGHLWHRWAADGTGVIAQADDNQIFFPLDGAARPLVWELAAAPSSHSLSSGGRLFADLVYDAPGSQQVVVGDTATGETVVASQRFEIAYLDGWTSDGRYAIAWLSQPLEAGAPSGLYAIDTAGWPAVQTATPLGVDVDQLGLESVMIAQATAVETQPWATVAVAHAAGPPESWPRREWVGPGLALAVPDGWRAQPLDQHHYAVANYDVTSPGLLVLEDDLFRADLFWSTYPSDQAPPFSVAAIREEYYGKDVSEIQIGDVTGAVLADQVTPLCETIILPHDAPGLRGQLWTTYCPATAQWREFVIEFLAQLEL